MIIYVDKSRKFNNGIEEFQYYTGIHCKNLRYLQSLIELINKEEKTPYKLEAIPTDYCNDLRLELHQRGFPVYNTPNGLRFEYLVNKTLGFIESFNAEDMELILQYIIDERDPYFVMGLSHHSIGNIAYRGKKLSEEGQRYIKKTYNKT